MPQDVEELASVLQRLEHPVNRPFIIGISGFGGSGKTTLASQLADTLGSTHTIHFDDFIIKDRLYDPLEDWECFDRGRLERQVLRPAHAGKPIRYQKLIWRADELGPTETVPACSYLIVEGISIWHPGLEKYYDFRIWVDVDPDVAAARGRKRENGNGYEVYWDLWKQNEARYLRKYRQDKDADFVISNNDEAA